MYKLYSQIWYVVIRVLFYTSSRYEVVGRTAVLNKLTHQKHFVYLVGLHIYYKMIHGPYNVKLNSP